jgi:hypothetical protein
MTNALRAFLDRRRLWLCVVAALVLGACASIEQGEAKGIKVTDSPVVSLPLAWMDNERILMRIDTGRRIDVPSGGQYAIFDLISYNYKTGERHNYGRAGSEICYADGYISRGWRDDNDNKKVIVLYGELGKETRRTIKPGEVTFERGARGSCRPWSELPERPHWANETTTIWNLWPRLGVIDCQTRAVSPLTKGVKARFHRPKDDIGVDLPFSCYEVIGGLRYYPTKGAYFALEWDFRSPWPQGRDRRAFWLHPDGHVDIVTYPYSYEIRFDAVPVPGGVLAFTRPADRGGDYWVYLVTPESSKRLYHGYAVGITSPDGCKVAMLIDPDFKKKARRRDVKTPVSLKVLDFCNTE